MRVTQGLEALDPNPEQSFAQYFYNEASIRIQNSRQMRGHYTESDAIAAIHLISYSLLSGGNTDWRAMLEIACDWLGQTGLTISENPKFAMSNMSEAGKFALKTTMVCLYLTLSTLHYTNDDYVTSG